MSESNYSIDSFIKTAFVKELQNTLYLAKPIDLIEMTKFEIVIEYMEKRIKEIDEQYKLR